jgi:hypothetical protein
VAVKKQRGSPGSRAWNVHACPGSQTPPCPTATLPGTVVTVWPSPCQNRIGTRKWRFRSSIAGLRFLWPMLHPRCYHRRRTVRGHGDWLVLPCGTLAFLIPSRFSPALSLTRFSLLGTVAMSVLRQCPPRCGERRQNNRSRRFACPRHACCTQQPCTNV